MPTCSGIKKTPNRTSVKNSHHIQQESEKTTTLSIFQLENLAFLKEWDLFWIVPFLSKLKKLRS